MNKSAHEELLNQTSWVFVSYIILRLAKVKCFMFYIIKLHWLWGDLLSSKQEIISKDYIMQNFDQKIDFC